MYRIEIKYFFYGRPMASRSVQLNVKHLLEGENIVKYCP